LIAEERPSVAGCVFINPMLKGPGAEMEQGLRDLIDSGLEILATDGNRTSRKRTPRRRSTRDGRCAPYRA